ncbi:MAG TPA: Xaa-Pro peptidase family protein [Candidatus Saccharimonadales bacterium]|nr:Xaa-Pro peptidase family protein [Candidatus Saccharimonadales bacterium]
MSERLEPRRLFNPDRLDAAMDSAGLDGVVAHSKRNFFYLSGFPSLDYLIDAESASYVLVPRDPARQAAVTIGMSERMGLEDYSLWIPDPILVGRFYIKHGPTAEFDTAGSSWEGMLLAIRRAGLEQARLGLELEQLPVGLHRRLREELPGLQVADCSKLLREVRMVKTPEEVWRIRVACEATEEAIKEARARVRPGQTEREVAQRIAAAMVERGVEVLYVQVATPAVAGLGGPSDRVIEKGDVIRTDVAAVYQGYHSDLGRGFAVGSATDEQFHYYEVAHQALRAGVDAVRPGVPAEAIFNSAMRVWKESGHPEVQRHHVGHGLGLQAHESPMLRPGVSTGLEEGMVLAVEVPCYYYGKGGFAPEDNLVVTTDGSALFTTAESHLPVIA